MIHFHVFNLQSAPRETRYLTISVFAKNAAEWRDVWPNMSVMFTLAPLEISHSAISLFPVHAAKWSGVHPAGFLVDISAPAAAKAFFAPARLPCITELVKSRVWIGIKGPWQEK